MSNTERKTLKSLGEWITVFRGCRDGMQLEMSWTLSVDVARTFAQRQADILKGDAFLISTQVHKDDVYGYFNGKKEMEIVWQPSPFTDYHVLEEVKVQMEKRVDA